MVELAAAVDIMKKSRHSSLDQFFLESLIAGCRVTFIRCRTGIPEEKHWSRGIPVI